jgi:hypothetical protein
VTARCLLCGRERPLQMHHLDWHHENNVASNRVRLCLDCHVYIHRVGYLTRLEIIELSERLRKVLDNHMNHMIG